MSRGNALTVNGKDDSAAMPITFRYAAAVRTISRFATNGPQDQLQALLNVKCVRSLAQSSLGQSF